METQVTQVAQPAQTVVQSAAQPAAQTGRTQPTKIQRALEIYLAAPEKRRKVIVERFMKELDMTPAGASTYYMIVKKRAAQQLAQQATPEVGAGEAIKLPAEGETAAVM